MLAKVIAEMAKSDACFDKRSWMGMSRTERLRYLQRSREAIAAAITYCPSEVDFSSLALENFMNENVISEALDEADKC
ncbi:hypothetical protein O9X81_00425 [Agrobacterium salinitolerans]|uniref:hypothetical protein n=1 Tax=Agrobacterium salinitolerans TaxID=1183413 RepID=UPI0022B83058|nr:hypothetical protein [Agrobacterium salinitolerans]MCZ7855073.1 hypothetical protein [Agrobacterium salinitolerans]